VVNKIVLTFNNFNLFIQRQEFIPAFVFNRSVIQPATGCDGNETTYHNQIAQIIAKLYGFDVKAAAGHGVGDEIKSVATGK
jgi:hypothetical protein